MDDVELLGELLEPRLNHGRLAGTRPPASGGVGFGGGPRGDPAAARAAARGGRDRSVAGGGQPQRCISSVRRR